MKAHDFNPGEYYVQTGGKPRVTFESWLKDKGYVDHITKEGGIILKKEAPPALVLVTLYAEELEDGL